MTEQEAIELVSDYIMRDGYSVADFEVSARFVSKDDPSRAYGTTDDEWVVELSLIALANIDPTWCFYRVNCRTKAVISIPTL